MYYTTSIERVVSCLLSDSDTRKVYQDKIKVLTLLDEICEGNIYGIDFTLLKIIDNIFKIKIGTMDFSVSIPRESLENILSVSIQSLIYEDGFNIKQVIKEEGLAFDLTIPKDVEEAMDYFYSQLLESINNIYSDVASITHALVELDALRNNMVDVIYRTSLMSQNEAYNTKGLEEAVEKMTEYSRKIDILKKIDITCNEDMSKSITLDTYEASKKFDEMNRGRFKDLFKTGVPPYDNKFSFSNQDITLIVAGINIGKTRFMIDQAYRCMMSKVNCTIVCTETKMSDVKSRLEMMHMYNLYGHRELTSKKIRFIEDLEDGEERDRYKPILEELEHCRADLYNNKKHGTATIYETFSYEGSLKFFIEQKNVHNSEVIFVDHVRNLSHEGKTPDGGVLKTEKESLAYLSTTMMRARKDYSIMFYIFSHPNSSYSKSSEKNTVGVDTNLSAGATEISECATRIFYLFQSLDEKANDIVRIVETKGRDEGIDTKSYALMRMGSCGVHIYDERLQTSGNEEYDQLEDLVDLEEE